MATCMIIIAIISAIYNQELVEKVSIYGNIDEVGYILPGPSYAIVIFLCIFVACFALSW